jgi:hypoxanthine phosphoribosyltransferase
MTAAGREIVTWAGLDALVADLAEQVGPNHDLILAVARGGLVPAGMLAYRLGIRDILVAAVAYYDDEGVRGEELSFLQFPAADLLAGRRVLIVDEVWETGTTIAAITQRVGAAGGLATTAVLHFKPGRSLVAGRPDHFAAQTDAWVVYPFKAGR